MANMCFSLYLHVVLLVSLYYAANGENNITIIPTDGSYSACPEQTLHCQSFSQFMNNSHDSSVFNSSNSIVLFLPGEHKLRNHWNKHLIVRGVNNITWHGESAGRTVPSIYCEEDIGFMFADIANLTIRNLEFVNCGHQLPSILSHSIFDSRQNFHLQSETWAAIAVANVDSVHMEHVTVKQSRGYGLFAINMLGKSSIDSCTFQDSNSQKFTVGEITRPKFVTPSKLVGGNAMIIFFDYRSTLMTLMTTNLSIRNSFFQNGSDNSEQKINQCNYLSNSEQVMRANGLAVITGQENYQVHFILERTTFTNNLGNYKFPSVLISDFSDIDTDNIFTITKCNFTNDGTFRLSLNKESTEGVKYGESNLVTLQVLECNFSDGIGTGIDICMNYEGFFKYYYRRINIENCTYQGYKDTPGPTKKHSEESVVLVKYNCQDVYRGCPNIQFEIKGCTFHRNQISSNTFFFGLIHEIHYNLLQPRMLITVKNCTYSKNKTPHKSTVTVIMLTKLNNKRIMWVQEVIDINHVIISNTLFVNNTSNFNGIVHIQNSLVTLDNCIFLQSKGSAVRANKSIITLKGVNEFSENTGQEGGGLSLIESRIRLRPNSTTTLFGNKADYGGGIFAIPVNYTRTVTVLVEQNFVLCTLILPTDNMTLLKKMNINIKLENNTAHVAGDSIFNGAYDGCYFFRGLDSRNSLVLSFINEHLLNVFDVKWSSQFEIASLPTKLCTCGRKSEQCIKTQVNAFPGEIFNISLVALGKLNGTTPVFVAGRTCLHYSNFSKCNHDYQSEIGHGGGEQPLSRFCTNISYSVNSPGDKVDMEIKIRNLKEDIPLLHFDSESTSPMIVEVNLLPCPIGFELAVGTRNERFCKCVDYLTKAGIVCNINTAEILCPNHKWVGVHSTDPYSFIVHNNCPFDYCIAGEKHIDLSVPDEQCSYNRSGVLCGECQSNMSLVLGSSNCKQCSNIYLFLILPFSLAGLALVVLLLKCNLTVSTGHINAIIFYANIVQVNKENLFTTQETAYKAFSAFIAWLNLDFGIETCFYKNMDAYGKVWLQFVFPVYVWILIGLIIVLANYSTRAARLIGNNSVPVLATLFILSYAKLLRTVIATVSFTYIEFQDGTNIPVWLQDGNVEYFSPKHTVLFIVALLFAIGYIVPLTLLVLFAPCLQARSHHKPLRWVNKLKPFLDAYQGPYNNKYRSWTGLMLVVSVFLFIVFASLNDPSVNYFCIVMVVFPIAIIVLSFSKTKFSVYRHRFANSLEAISLLNIVILSALNWLMVSAKYEKWPSIRIGFYFTYISVGVTVLQFLVIIFHRVILKLCPQIFKRKKKQNADPQPVIKEMTMSAPTHSVVELCHRESLIEPLLETEDERL